MYNSQEIASRIKRTAKTRGESVNHLLTTCGLGVNTVSKIGRGGDILTLNFAKIADCLDCSVDYLLGRTDNPEINGSVSVVNNSTGSVGFNHGTVTVNGVSEECAELVRIYASLDIRQRVRLLNMAIEVADGAT